MSALDDHECEAAATVLGAGSAPNRKTFLGGSDAAAVMGLSPYATPVELWQRKTGRVEEQVDARMEKMRARGHKLEPFIRDMAIDRLRDDFGLHVELVAVNQRYADLTYPFLACEIDFELRLTGTTAIDGEEVTFDGELVNADAKSVTGFARKKWGAEEATEDVPIEYAAQFMHGLMVTGRRYCLVAALRSFDDVDIYWTVRDDETIAAMRRRELAFWHHVTSDTPPDPLEFSDIKALFPLDNGAAIEATDEIAEKVAQYKRIKAEIKNYTEAEKALQYEIAEFIAPNSRLTVGGKDVLTWKAQNWTGLDEGALRQAHPALFAEFCKTKVIRVMRVKK